MDRFIANKIEYMQYLKQNLKSNMDRFIGHFSYHKVTN